MKYLSRVIQGLEYEINRESIYFYRDGYSKSYPVTELGNVIQKILEKDMADELISIYGAFTYLMAIKINNTKTTIEDKNEIAKLLGISYGEFQTKRQKGELII